MRERVGVPLSVPPSHGRSSSSKPLQPFASHADFTSSEDNTATRGDNGCTIESGGEGMMVDARSHE